MSPHPSAVSPSFFFPFLSLPLYLYISKHIYCYYCLFTYTRCGCCAVPCSPIRDGPIDTARQLYTCRRLSSSASSVPSQMYVSICVCVLMSASEAFLFTALLSFFAPPQILTHTRIERNDKKILRRVSELQTARHHALPPRQWHYSKDRHTNTKLIFSVAQLRVKAVFQWTTNHLLFFANKKQKRSVFFIFVLFFSPSFPSFRSWSCANMYFLGRDADVLEQWQQR